MRLRRFASTCKRTGDERDGDRDLRSAAVVFIGTSVLHLSIGRFALVNVVLVAAWMSLALVVLNRRPEASPA
jgi:hypothetical protein